MKWWLAPICTAIVVTGTSVGAATKSFVLEEFDLAHCEDALAHLNRSGRAVMCAFGGSINVQEFFNAQIEWLEARIGGRVQYGEIQVSRGDTNTVICARVWTDAPPITD